MPKVLVLSFNSEADISGPYHQNLVNAIYEVSDVVIYGPGYPNYKNDDSINDVFKKLNISEDCIDAIIVTTSWENQDEMIEESDPHPNICLKDVSKCKKVFFLNKEYKKLEKKLEYIKKNKFDVVLTVLPKERYAEWESYTGVKFIQSHFGIDLNQFRDLGLKRKYDFTFTGALHERYTNQRVNVKKELFRKMGLTSNKGLVRVLHWKNPISKPYRKFDIYWAEWGKWSRDLSGKSLLPSGEDYVKLMNQSKTFLCTLSAEGIFGTRFFELMACGSLIICPKGDYYGILRDGENCIMYKEDMSDFYDKLNMLIENDNLRLKITEQAKTEVLEHSYVNRIKKLYKILELN